MRRQGPIRSIHRVASHNSRSNLGLVLSSTVLVGSSSSIMVDPSSTIQAGTSSFPVVASHHQPPHQVRPCSHVLAQLTHMPYNVHT